MGNWVTEDASAREVLTEEMAPSCVIGDEAVGVISAAFYSADFGSDSNKRFVAAMQKDYNVLPGGYSAGMYVAGQCVEAAIQALGGKADELEKRLLDLASEYCAALRGLPALDPLFSELEEVTVQATG